MTTAEHDNNASGRRRLESRKKLLLAARKLFVERGFHATRPQDVAKAAGVGHGTFYLHFADKRDCFLAFVEEARAELNGEIERRIGDGSGDLRHRIEQTLHAIFDYADANPGVLATALSDEAVIAVGHSNGKTLLDLWGEQWAGQLADIAEQTGLVPDYDPEIAGQAIVGMIHQATQEAYRRHRPRAALIQTLTTLLRRALVPER